MRFSGSRALRSSLPCSFQLACSGVLTRFVVSAPKLIRVSRNGGQVPLARVAKSPNQALCCVAKFHFPMQFPNTVPDTVTSRHVVPPRAAKSSRFQIGLFGFLCCPGGSGARWSSSAVCASRFQIGLFGFLCCPGGNGARWSSSRTLTIPAAHNFFQCGVI